MPQLVDVEGIGQVEFPDHYTPAMIQDYWKQNFQPKLQQQNRIQAGIEAANRPEDTPNMDALKSTARQMIVDPAIDIGRGVIGVPEALVGLADIPTFGYTGKLLENIPYGPRFSEAKDILGEGYSPERRQAMQRVQDAKGFFPTLQSMVENPSTLVGTTLESLPSMFGGGAVAQKGLSLAAKLGPRAAAWAAGASAPVVAGAAGEAAVSAGQTAEQIRNETPNRTLSWDQAGLALASGVLTGGIGVAAGKLSQALGIENLHTYLARGGSATTAKSLSERIAKGIGGAITEGLFEELPQSTQEQIAQNIALGKAWDEGVGEQAAAGLLAGAAMGGVAGGFGPGHHAAPGPVQTPPPAGSTQGAPVAPAPTPTAPAGGPAPSPTPTPTTPKAPPPYVTPHIDPAAPLPPVSKTLLNTVPIQNWVDPNNGVHILAQTPDNLAVGQKVTTVTKSAGQDKAGNPIAVPFGSTGTVVAKTGPKFDGNPNSTVTVQLTNGDIIQSGYRQFATADHYTQAQQQISGAKGKPFPSNFKQPANTIGLPPGIDPNAPVTTRTAPLTDSEVLLGKIAAARAAGDIVLARKLAAELDNVQPPVQQQQPAPKKELAPAPAPMAPQSFSDEDFSMAALPPGMSFAEPEPAPVAAQPAPAPKPAAPPRLSLTNPVAPKAPPKPAPAPKLSVQERLGRMISTPGVKVVDRASATAGYGDLRKRGGITMGVDTRTGDLLLDKQNVLDIHRAIREGRTDIAEAIMDRLESAAAHENIHNRIYSNGKYNPAFEKIASDLLNGNAAKSVEEFVRIGLKHLLSIEHYRRLFEESGVILHGGEKGQVNNSDINYILKRPEGVALALNELLAGHGNTRGVWTASEHSRYNAIRAQLLNEIGIPKSLRLNPVEFLPKKMAEWMAGSAAPTRPESSMPARDEFPKEPIDSTNKWKYWSEKKDWITLRVFNSNQFRTLWGLLNDTGKRQLIHDTRITQEEAKRIISSGGELRTRSELLFPRHWFSREAMEPFLNSPPTVKESGFSREALGEFLGAELSTPKEKISTRPESSMATRTQAPLNIQREPVITPEIAAAAQAAVNPQPGVPEVKRVENPRAVLAGARRLSLTNPNAVAVVPKPEPKAVTQTPTPETFNSVDELLAFRKKRLAEEVALYRQEIGLTQKEAQELHDLVFREASTKKFEQRIGPEKAARMEQFFEHSPYNKKGHPFEFWEGDKRLNPEEVASENPDALPSALISAVVRGVDERVTSDRYISAAIAARRMAENGITKSDLIREIDKYTTRESSSQPDKIEFAKTITDQVARFLESVGVNLPDGDLKRTPKVEQASGRLSLTNPKGVVAPKVEPAAPVVDKTAKFDAALSADKAAYRAEVYKRPVEQQPPRMWYENEAAKRGIGPDELTGDEIRGYRQQWDNAVKAAVSAGRPVYAIMEKPPKKGWVKRGEIWYPPEGAKNPPLTSGPERSTVGRMNEELTAKPVEQMSPSEADAFENKHDADKKAEALERNKFTPEDIASIERDLKSDPRGAVIHLRESEIWYSVKENGKRVKTFSVIEYGIPGTGFYQREANASGLNRDQLLKWLNDRHEFWNNRGTYELYGEDGHDWIVKSAVSENKPVNAAAVGTYKISLPAGYVREGDLYVYKPEAKPAEPSPTPPATPKVVTQEMGNEGGSAGQIKSSGIVGIHGSMAVETELFKLARDATPAHSWDLGTGRKVISGNGLYFLNALDLFEKTKSIDMVAEYLKKMGLNRDYKTLLESVVSKSKPPEYTKNPISETVYRGETGGSGEGHIGTSVTTSEDVAKSYGKVSKYKLEADDVLRHDQIVSENDLLERGMDKITVIGLPIKITGRDVVESVTKYLRDKHGETSPKAVGDYLNALGWKAYKLAQQSFVFDRSVLKPEQPSTTPAAPLPQGVAQEGALGKNVGARKATPEGMKRVGEAQQRLRDIINNPDIVGKQRVDMIANGKQLIAFLQANADTRKPISQGIEHGDAVAYTGEDAPEGFRSFIFLEGHRAGEYGVAATPESRAATTAKSKQEFADQQAAFKRVRESGSSDQMPASKPVAGEDSRRMLTRDEIAKLTNQEAEKAVNENRANINHLTDSQKRYVLKQSADAIYGAVDTEEEDHPKSLKKPLTTDAATPMVVPQESAPVKMAGVHAEETVGGTHYQYRLKKDGDTHKIEARIVRPDGSFSEWESGGFGSGTNRYETAYRFVERHPDATLHDSAFKNAKTEYLERKATREAAEAKQKAEAEAESKRRSDYDAEVDATELPKAEKKKILTTNRDGGKTEVDATVYGGIAIIPTGNKTGPYKFKITHVASGLGLGNDLKIPTLAQAKQFIKALIHSSADLTKASPSNEDLMRMSEAKRAMFSEDVTGFDRSGKPKIVSKADRSPPKWYESSKPEPVSNEPAPKPQINDLIPQVSDEVTWRTGAGDMARATVQQITKMVNDQEPMATVDWFGSKRVPISQLEIVKKSSRRVAEEQRTSAKPLTTDAAIAAIDNLQKKLKGKTFSDPFLSTVWGPVALQVAKHILRAGRPLEVAIREAVDKVRQQFPASGIDAQSAAQSIQQELAAENEALNAAERTAVNQLEVNAAAESIPNLAAQQYADLEDGYSTLDKTAFEKSQFRQAKSALSTLVNLADGAIRRMPEDQRHPDLYPKVTDGIATAGGRIVVDDTFSQKLTALGIQHNPDNVKAMQAELYFEHLSRKASDARERLQDLRDRLAYYQKINAPAAEVKRLQDLIALNTAAIANSEATVLERNGADVAVGDRVNELKQAESNRIEAQAKVDALHLGPVADFFGAGIARLRNLFDKAKAARDLIDELRKTTTDPEKLKTLADEYRRYGDLPATIQNAIEENTPLDQRQQDAVVSELQKAFLEFDDARQQMNALLQQEQVDIIKQIEDAQQSFSKSANDTQENEALIQAALNAAKGDPSLAHSVLTATEVDSLLNNVTAITNLAKHLGENLTQNRWLYDFLSGWRASPGGSVTFSPIDATSLNVSPEVLQKVIDVAGSSPQFASSIVALADAAAAAKAASNPAQLVGALPSIADALKLGGKPGLNAAAKIANQLGRTVNPAVVASRADNRQASRTINKLLTRLTALNHGADLFNNLVASPQFQTLRGSLDFASGAGLTSMIERPPSGFVFKEFGTNGQTPNHQEVVINVAQDPSTQEAARKKMLSWFDAAEKYCDDYDRAYFLSKLDPTAKTPEQLGFKESVARGLRAEIGNGRGEFLDTGFNRLKTATISRQLQKLPWFRQHEAAVKMVGGIIGNALRTSMGRWIQGTLDSKRVMSRFEDLPKLTSQAMLSHEDPANPNDNSHKNYEVYRQRVFNPMAHEGRKFGSELKVGFQLPTGAIVTKEDMALLRRQLQLNGFQRTEVSETNPLRGVRFQVGGDTFIRKSGSVGDYGMDRHLNQHVKSFIANMAEAYKAGGFDAATDLTSSSSNPVVQFWNSHNQMLIDHINDSGRTDRSMKLDPAMQEAEKRLAALWKSGAEVQPSNLAELASQLATTLKPLAGVNPVSYVTERLNSELAQYAKEGARIQSEREENERNSGIKVALSADNEFTKPAKNLELPSSLYNYGALTPGERIAKQSAANHQNIVEYANSLRRAVGELRSRLDGYNSGKLSAKEAAEHYGGDINELKDTLQILSAIQKDFEAAFTVNDPSLLPSRIASEIAKFAVSGVLALPTVNLRNLTQGQLLVYLSDIAMGITMNRMALWHAVANMPRGLARLGYVWANGAAKFVDKNLTRNSNALEKVVDVMADAMLAPARAALRNPAISAAGWKADLEAVKQLGYDTKQGWTDAMNAAWLESALFTNRDDQEWAARNPKLAAVQRTALTAAKTINAFLGSVGVENSDQVLNSLNLARAAALEQRLTEVAMQYGKRLEDAGHTEFNVSDPAFQLKPSEWSTTGNEQARKDALENARLLFQTSASAEGFQLEKALWDYYQNQKAGRDIPIYTDRQRDAVSRTLLAAMNSSLPSNRASVSSGSAIWRSVLTLQGYPADAMLKLINIPLSGTRDRRTAATIAAKLPMLFGIATMMLLAGAAADGASEYWKRRMQGIVSSQAGVLDKDFWDNKDKFASGVGRFLASNMFYIGDIILGLQNQIQGSRGFDPASRVFLVSLIQAFSNAAMGAVQTAKGAGKGTDFAIPLMDAARRITPGANELSRLFGANNDARRSEQILAAEGRSQNMQMPRPGAAPMYGPTTVVRRLLQEDVSSMARAQAAGDSEGYNKAFASAQGQIAKLEEYYIQHRTELGDTPEEAIKHAKQAVWRDYQETNPVVAAMGGRRVTNAEYQSLTSGATGERAEIQQRGIEAWQAGAQALFGRPGAITKEEVAATRGGSGVSAVAATAGGGGSGSVGMISAGRGAGPGGSRGVRVGRLTLRGRAPQRARVSMAGVSRLQRPRATTFKRLSLTQKLA